MVEAGGGVITGSGEAIPSMPTCGCHAAVVEGRLAAANMQHQMNDALDQHMQNENSSDLAQEGSVAGQDAAAPAKNEKPGSFAADEKGNVLPVPPGGKTQGSPDGKWVQVKDASGKPTGARIDNGHPESKSHSDPRSQKPHAHLPDKTNADGTPWLPVIE